MTGIGTAVDAALDRSIVLGYATVGLLARRRLPGWPADAPRMDGRAVLVTGAAGGLGLASACGYARLGATVYALARSAARAADAVAAIQSAAPGADVRPEACDVSSLAAVRDFGADFAEREPRLDVLVNNAGVMPDARARSAEDHELMFATHVLAPLALVTVLGGVLLRSAPSRVINVSSGGMYSQGLPVDDWESEQIAYGPKTVYARTKREEVVITELMAERLRERGVAVHAMHPGWADTDGVRRRMRVLRNVTRPILRSSEEGADTIVWLGAAPEAVDATGLFWQDRRPRPTHYRFGAGPNSERDRQALWRYCQAALGEAGIASL
jgi:NAD(P)-dependent dehydrogenase (short-subunit alcohol dehydrogenase family)